MSDFYRVNSADPCEACHGTTGCTYTLHGNLRSSVCCRDRSTGRFASDGRGLHRTWKENRSEGLRTPPHPLPANIRRRDRVYNAMLELCTLEDREREELLSRGLSEEQIAELERLGYKTTQDVAQELDATGFELARVPGFYQEDGVWRANCRPGFWVPVRDAQGRISALQMRRTDGAKSKYQWFSSYLRVLSDGTRELLPYGASTGSPVHHIAGAGKTVFVIEGAMKAQISRLYIDHPFLSMQGAKSGHQELARACLDFDSAVFCVDADWRTNEDLKRDWCRLYEEVRRRAGIPVKLALWPEQWKGLDDALIAENKEVVLADFQEVMG